MRGAFNLSGVIVVFARVVLGGLFIYMGIHKTLQPVEFLKLLREYDLTQSAMILNLIAATLPWFEIFTGLLLVLGIGVQGAGVLIVGMLVPFTVVIARRAAGIHESQGLPFCAIRFDCGCGAGEVLICRKLLENSALIVLGLLVAFIRAPRLALRYSIFGSRG
jgi:hypothetical protein